MPTGFIVITHVPRGKLMVFHLAQQAFHQKGLNILWFHHSAQATRLQAMVTSGWGAATSVKTQ
jgi:hypothetical protein